MVETPRSSSLPQRIASATSRGGTITFVSGDDEPVRISWAQLHEEACAVAGGLQSRGIGVGSHVALLAPTTRALVTTIQATWLVGAAAVVLPLPMRMSSIEEFVSQTRVRVRNADAALLVIDQELAPFVEPEPGDPPIAGLQPLGTWAVDPPSIDPASLAVLQFTSGSTSDPKGVMLPHRTILANLDGAEVAAQVDVDEDCLVSWLPLYHDMGLIGMLTLPMITGFDLVLGAPQDFMASPSRWVEWLSHFKGTATAGPNFSYALAARAMKRLDNLDLSRFRLALNGAEPVDPATVAAFCEAGARHGFRPGSAFPAFGMAELAIAGTFPVPGTGLRMDTVDRVCIEHDRFAKQCGPEDGKAFALLGRPVPGLEIRICEPETGAELADREVGELEFRGTSVTPGYYNHPEATAAAFHDEWLRTGDLAYRVDGELVVCGRIKDMIIVGGRNVYPEDVERAVAGVDGVRAGNVIAFGVPGRRGQESVVVVAETKADDPAPVRDEVARRVRQSVGLPPSEVVLVHPGTLPKTSSGKLQRSLCRTRYLDDELIPA
jgi:fatty-acyl-CoA synthase